MGEILGDQAAERTDLFGLPLAAERGKGRPAHVWSAENSQKVCLLFACGKKPIEVAKVLGISKPTFYKHYFNEIERAGCSRDMLLGVQLARLNRAAEAGNVAAEKALLGMVHAEQLRGAASRLIDRPVERKAEAKGKKEVQQERAWDAGKDDESWGGLLHGETGAALPN